jgi:dihydroorotate dehydrogenase electron transfer subunit
VKAAARAEPRTLAPPERRVARVSGVEQLGAYQLMTAVDHAGPADPRPGQFYMLATEQRWGGGADERPYLPRAFSHARARVGGAADGVGTAAGRDGAGAAPAGAGLSLSFLLEAVGPGTERLSRLGPGEGLSLVGPLGIGFRRPPEGAPALLVGGGIGAAPLLCLQEELPDARALLGFRTAAHAQAAALFAGEPEIVTDDGSVGRQALVTEPLAGALDANPDAVVFACGPPAMLEAVRALCAARGVAAQLALEAGMACGFGACFGCVVPTTEGYVRLCVDGPVLDAERLESAIFPGAGH